MKFKHIGAARTPVASGSGRPRGMSGWLKEWIANKTSWCKFDCGHMEAWDELSLCALHHFGPRTTEVWCERCQKFVLFKKWVTFNEYKGIPPAVTPDEPLF